MVIKHFRQQQSKTLGFILAKIHMVIKHVRHTRKQYDVSF